MVFIGWCSRNNRRRSVKGEHAGISKQNLKFCFCERKIVGKISKEQNEMWITILLISGIGLASSQVNFVAVGNDAASGNSIVASADGINWSLSGTGIFSAQGTGIAYGSSMWVATGQGTNSIAWSLDGMSWTGLGTTTFSVQGNGVYFSSAQSRWVAVGQGTNSIAWSADGLVWVGLGTTTFTVSGNDVVFSPSLNLWVAVGGSTNTIARSANAVSWTGSGVVVFNGAVGSSISWSIPLSQFIATGQGTNSLGRSADGISWTGGGSLFSTGGRDAFFGQSKWLAVGPQGTQAILSSTDGISWAGIASGMTNGAGITYNSFLNIWVAVGSGASSSFHSSDGINWVTGQNLFVNFGLDVASNTPDTTAPTTVTTTTTQAPTTTTVTQPPTPAPNQITTDVGTLITNTSVITLGSSINIIGNFTVNGDLFVDGNWIIGPQSVTAVNNTLQITGSTNFTSGGIISSNAMFVSQMATFTLTLILTEIPGIGNSTTIEVARYNYLQGEFIIHPTQIVILQPGGRNIAISQSNEYVIQTTPYYSGSAMSLTVTILPPSSVVAASSDSIPVYAIVVPIIACVGLGIGIAIGIVYVSKRKQIQRTLSFQSSITKAELERAKCQEFVSPR